MNGEAARTAALKEAVRRLRQPSIIRQRCGAITEAVTSGRVAALHT